MAKNHSLVAKDDRLPVTIALDHAFATGQISAECIALRKQELTDLTAEAAKTFGFQSKTTLSHALDIVLGLISLSLSSSTGGKTNPEEWAEKIVVQSWKILVKESIALARAIKEKDEAHGYLFESDKDPRTLRDHLRDFALRRDKLNQWVGDKVFLEYRKDREQTQTADALVRWLIRTLVKRSLPWMNDPSEGPASTDEALNTLLFRVSTGLGFKQKDITLSEQEFTGVRKQYDANPTAWTKNGQTRYDILFATVPRELQSGLDEKWFEHHFKKGPPRVKNWDAEDLPGIMGVYHYQVYF